MLVAKVKTKSKAKELDGPYFLKMVIYLILGMLWLKVYSANGLRIPIAIGLIGGVFFARRDRYQIDRKIEYAVLLMAMLVGYFTPYGLYVQL